jgi:LuxR family maltose regulon positive regulatory protein
MYSNAIEVERRAIDKLPIFAMLAAHQALQEGVKATAKAAMSNALKLCKKQGESTFNLLNKHVVKDLLIWSYQQGIEKEYVKQSLKNLMIDGPGIFDMNTRVDKPVKISTLGHFSVQVGDQTLSYTRAGYNKPFDLLKALISFGGRQVNRTRIIDTLWPDAEGDSARRNFDTTLHRLRKLLKHSKALVLHGSQLTLDPHYVWVDIWELERSASQLEGELHRLSGSPELIRQLTDHYLELYKGHYLNNDHVRPWTLTMRDSLSTRFNHLLGRLGKYWSQQGNSKMSIRLYLRGIELSPTCEEFYQELMNIYVQQGRLSEAASTYLRCRKALATQLSVLPSSDTVRIYKAISTV